MNETSLGPQEQDENVLDAGIEQFESFDPQNVVNDPDGHVVDLDEASGAWDEIRQLEREVEGLTDRSTFMQDFGPPMGLGGRLIGLKCSQLIRIHILLSRAGGMTCGTGSPLSRRFPWLAGQCVSLDAVIESRNGLMIRCIGTEG